MNLSDTEYNSIETLCERFKEYNAIDASYYKKYEIKRGLRNADGTGVVAGLTKICNVHGYVLNEHEREPIDGKLIYRGIDIEDLIAGFTKGGRYGFEAVSYTHLVALPRIFGPTMANTVLAMAKTNTMIMEGRNGFR